MDSAPPTAKGFEIVIYNTIKPNPLPGDEFLLFVLKSKHSLFLCDVSFRVCFWEVTLAYFK